MVKKKERRILWSKENDRVRKTTALTKRHLMRKLRALLKSTLLALLITLEKKQNVQEKRYEFCRVNKTTGYKYDNFKKRQIMSKRHEFLNAILALEIYKLTL